MAVLGTEEIVDRFYDVFEAKFDTHKADVASDIDPIRTFDTIPPGGRKPTPAVAFFAGSGTDEDAPQEIGSTLTWRFSCEAILEVPYVDRLHAAKVHKFKDALVYTVKKECELLDPTTGEKLQYLYKAWPVDWEIRWGKAPRGARAHIKVTVEVIVDELETY